VIESSEERPFVADAALVFLTAIWGATFLFVKDAISDADPMTFLAVRFTLGAAIALGLSWRALFEPSLLRSGVVLGIFLFAGYATQTLGLGHTTPSRSAFITGLSVLLVPFVSVLLFRRAPSPPSYVGMLLALFGLAWLTGMGRGLLTREYVLGDGLTVACAVAFSVHITLTERYAQRHPATPLVAVQLLVVAALSAAFLPWLRPHWQTTRSLMVAVLYCGLAAGVGALVLQTWAQRRTTAVRAALIYALEPVWTALYAAVLHREPVGLSEVCGGGLIVLGVVTAEGGGALWRRYRPETV
jgi:drug/metabolite transporter (DMT)-like permease